MRLPDGVVVRDGNAPQAIERAAQALAQGHLVAFPTETVYGLGADGLDAHAVEKIFKAKGRPADHPLILHVADLALARSLAREWPEQADALASAFWPGPLTLILKRAAQVPLTVTGGQDTVGVRMPAHPVAIALLRAFARQGSGVVAAPSANRFGAVSPTRAMDVAQSLAGRLDTQDMILDGGPCDVGVESTIVDLASGAARILRPGGITRAAIERALAVSLPLGRDMDNGKGTEKVPRVSGSLASHYAPRAEAVLVTPEDMLLRVQAFLAQQPDAHARVVCMIMDSSVQERMPMHAKLTTVIMPSQPRHYAQQLYAQLHDADQHGTRLILIQAPPDAPAWEAVNDRLRRATHQ